MGSELASGFLAWGLAVGVGSCAATGGDDCHHSCLVNGFAVTVPKDRVTDVASVTPTGPCSASQGSVYPESPETYFFSVYDIGVCRITVTFQSGAPDFVADVKITASPGPCCAGQARAQTGVVAVPESGPADASTDN